MYGAWRMARYYAAVPPPLSLSRVSLHTRCCSWTQVQSVPGIYRCGRKYDVEHAHARCNSCPSLREVRRTGRTTTRVYTYHYKLVAVPHMIQGLVLAMLSIIVAYLKVTMSQ
jgi:hypothetical protein